MKLFRCFFRLIYMKGQAPEKTAKGRNHMKKRSLKALTLFLTIILLLPCLDLGAG